MNKMFRTSIQSIPSRGRELALRGSVALLAALPLLASAQADPAVTAISDAQAKALAVCAGLVALVIAVWGALYIKGFFGKK